jgi:hypothetical protein
MPVSQIPSAAGPPPIPVEDWDVVHPPLTTIL